MLVLFRHNLSSFLDTRSYSRRRFLVYFWEFATDHYDIGFGVYFEWTLASTNKVTVYISESDGESEEEEGK